MSTCNQCGCDCGSRNHQCTTCGHLMCIDCAMKHDNCPKCGGREVRPRPGYENEAIDEARNKGAI